MASYLPKKIFTGAELDKKLGLEIGHTESISGVAQRHYADETETNSYMAARAIEQALKKANLRLEDLDLILSGSGTQEQAIPCNAALIQRQLGSSATGIPSFDINSTCLSFVTGLDMASQLIATGRYKRIALVSSDIASVGLNWKQTESCSLFGDGAVAAILAPTPAGETSKVISAHMETYSEGHNTCEIRGGGTRLHPRKINYTAALHEDDFLFNMDGRRVFKIALTRIGPFLEKTLRGTGLSTSDLDLVIPHQASASGMELVRRKLDIPSEKWMSILQNHGNMIAASIPLALSLAIESGKLKRGQKALLIGTSAGLSIGGLVLEY